MAGLEVWLYAPEDSSNTISLFLCHVKPPVGLSSLKQSFKFMSYIKSLSNPLALTSFRFSFLFILSTTCKVDIEHQLLNTCLPPCCSNFGFYGAKRRTMVWTWKTNIFTEFRCCTHLLAIRKRNVLKLFETKRSICMFVAHLRGNQLKRSVLWRASSNIIIIRLSGPIPPFAYYN